MDLCLRIDVKPKCFFLLSFPGSCRLLHPSIHPIRLSHSLLLRCCRFFSRGSCCPPVVFHLFLFCFVLFFFFVLFCFFFLRFSHPPSAPAINRQKNTRKQQ